MSCIQCFTSCPLPEGERGTRIEWPIQGERVIYGNPANLVELWESSHGVYEMCVDAPIWLAHGLGRGVLSGIYTTSGCVSPEEDRSRPWLCFAVVEYMYEYCLRRWVLGDNHSMGYGFGVRLGHAHTLSISFASASCEQSHREKLTVAGVVLIQSRSSTRRSSGVGGVARY